MKRFFWGALVVIYIVISSFVTSCLLNFNDYNVTEFSKKVLFVVKKDGEFKNSKKGDLLVLEKSSNFNEGDLILYYDTYDRVTDIKEASVRGMEKITDKETTFELDNGKYLSQEYVIGKMSDSHRYSKVGYVLDVLESKWGFLFIIVLPMFVLLLYEIRLLFGYFKPKKKRKRKKKRGKKNRRIKKKAIIIAVIILLTLIVVFLCFYNSHITNIYITGNKYLSDEEIIKMADLEDYPNIFKANSVSIKLDLEKNIYIRKATVYKKGIFNQVYITIYENYPLFIYHDKTYLYDGKTIDEVKIAPTLTNDIDDSIYDEFIKCMQKVDIDILERISEIKYDPNDVDKERFYLTMNDGIYVYVTLNKFDKINDYDDIVSTLQDKKGILYLDNGEYFEVFKN